MLFLFNQTAQAVALANTISPFAGRAVLSLLLGFYAVALILPIVMIARLPKRLLPVAANSPGYDAYLMQIGARLAANPLLVGGAIGAMTTTGKAGIDAALEILDGHALEVIKRNASSVFLSTAVSQNGSLDALVVLAAQIRMVWVVAHIYNQRPAFAEMAELYGNAGSAVFLAGQLESLDIGEQIDPLIRAVIGPALAGAVPGLSSVTALIAKSILDGAANAFLTLRVGVIAQRYCRATAPVDRGALRRNSSVVASGMLGAIVTAAAGRVVSAIIASAKKASAASAGAVTTAAQSAVSGIAGKLNPFS